MPHLAMKFQFDHIRICNLHVVKKIVRECYVMTIKLYVPSRKARRFEVAMTDLDPRTNIKD